jgi:hypothetical protein
MEDTLRAYDWIRLADQIGEQLSAARAKLAESGDHAKEMAWLAEASELVSQDREGRDALLSKARRLPELASVRQEHAADLIAPWVDALEHLHAGIVYHAGLRSPLIEALFPHKKFDGLRRANVESAQTYGTDFMRRLRSSYLERLLARDEFAFARPSVDEVVAKYAALAPDGEAALEEAEAAEVNAALGACARQLELAIKQARLLAEAALSPLPGTFEELAMRNKPKTRSAPKEKAAPKVESAEPEAVASEAPKKAAPKKAKEPAKSKAEPKAKAAKEPKAKEAKPKEAKAKEASAKNKPAPKKKAAKGKAEANSESKHGGEAQA